MLPILLAAALAIPFLHRHHHNAKSPSAVTREIVQPDVLKSDPLVSPLPAVPTVRIGDPDRQELEQTPGE